MTWRNFLQLSGARRVGARVLLRCVVVLALTATAFATATVTGPDAQAQATNVTMIVGSVNASGRAPRPDRPVIALLEEMGLSVTLVDDDDAQAGDADSTDLLVVSSSVVPSKIRDLFTEISVPLLTWEGHLFDNFGFTDGPNGELSTTQTSLIIEDPDSPVAAGYSGSVQVITDPRRFAYAEPLASANIVATVDTRPVIFTFDEGDVFAARAVGMFMNKGSAERLTDAGADIFEAAVTWVLDDTPIENDAPTVDAGLDATTTGSGTVSVLLDGTMADDGLPNPPGAVTALWTSDDAGVVFADPTAVDTLVNLPSPGTYTLLLTAFDGELSTSDPVTVTVTDPSETLTALMIAGNTAPPSGDRDVLVRLEAGGFDVTIIDDDSDFSSQNVAAYDALVISSSVIPDKIGSTFSTAPIPILTWENYLFDDFGLATSVGTAPGDSIVIADPDSDLAAGLSGTPAVYTNPGRISWGRATSGTDVVAHVLGDPTKATILVGGLPLVPKRIGMFPDYLGADELSADGQALFDAAVAFLYVAAGDNDQSPIVDLGPDIAILEPSVSLTPTITNKVPFEPPPTESWTQIDGPGVAAFSPNDRADTTVTFSESGAYTLQFSYTTEAGTGVDTIVITVSLGPDPENKAPVVTAQGPDRILVGDSLPRTHLLVGTATDDGIPGVGLTAEWSLLSGPAGGVTIESPSELTTAVTFVRDAEYVFKLSVSDGELSSTAQTTVVAQEDFGFLSEVFISGDQLVLWPDAVSTQLVGRHDYGIRAETEWTQSWGPPATIADPSALTTGITFAEPGVYAFTLSVELESPDGFTATDRTTAKVLVRDTEGRQALLVAGNATPPSGDRQIAGLIEDAGFNVTIVDDDSDLAAIDTGGLDLIVLSSSVVPSKVGSVFRGVSVPLLTWENYLFDDVGLAVTVGTSAGDSIEIADPTSPLAAGLNGTVQVYSSPSRLSWGNVGEGNDELYNVIAHVPGEPNKATIIYDNGAIAGGTNRVALFPDYLGANRLTESGVALVNAALALLRDELGQFLRFALVDVGPDVTLASAADKLVIEPTIVNIEDFSSAPSYHWRQRSGPDGVTFVPDGFDGKTTMTFPGPGIYRIELNYGTGELFGHGDDALIVTVGG